MIKVIKAHHQVGAAATGAFSIRLGSSIHLGLRKALYLIVSASNFIDRMIPFDRMCLQLARGNPSGSCCAFNIFPRALSFWRALILSLSRLCWVVWGERSRT